MKTNNDQNCTCKNCTTHKCPCVMESKSDCCLPNINANKQDKKCCDCKECDC